MNELRCSDVGDENCEFIARGESDDEIKNNMIDHFRKDHTQRWESMGPHDKMEFNKRIEQWIK